MKPLMLAEQWKKKCFEFSAHSDDNLVPVITKLIDTLAFYLKDSAHPRLQPALKTLECERSIHLSEEISDVPSIRIMMYGIIQSVHGLLLTKTAFNDSNSSEAKAILAMVGDWKVKCCVLSNELDDILLSVVEKVLYAIVMILKGAEQSCIQTTLKALDYELSVCKFKENIDELSIRTLMYGVIECVHGCLLDMTALNISIPSEEFHLHEAPLFTLSPKKEPKEEIDNDEQINPIGDDRRFENEDMMNGDMRRRLVKEDAKSEPDNKKRPLSKRSDTELECPECKYRSNSVTGWINHLRYKHYTTPILAGLALRCQCGHESHSYLHSVKCEVANFTVIRKRKGPIRRLDDAKCEVANFTVVQRIDNEKETPQCTLCEVYPKTAIGYMLHLRRHHKTTLLSNGLELKCGCGFLARCRNSYDVRHKKQCNGRQFSLHKISKK